jgi:hypothetical protein
MYGIAQMIIPQRTIVKNVFFLDTMYTTFLQTGSAPRPVLNFFESFC